MLTVFNLQPQPVLAGDGAPYAGWSIRFLERIVFVVQDEPRQLTVVLKDNRGKEMVLRKGVRFRSYQPDVVTVSADGRIVAHQAGAVQIQAIYMGMTADAVVFVTEPTPDVAVDFSEKEQGFEENDFFTIEDGIFRFNGGESGFYERYYSKAAPADFTVEVKARWDEGEEDNGYGLIFRADENKNEYAFLISADGSFLLAKYRNGDWENLIDWKSTDLIKSDFNVLKTTCRGRSIRCYLNDEMVADIEDEEPAANEFSVGVGSNSKIKCSFDDFSVKFTADAP